MTAEEHRPESPPCPLQMPDTPAILTQSAEVFERIARELKQLRSSLSAEQRGTETARILATAAAFFGVGHLVAQRLGPMQHGRDE